MTTLDVYRGKIKLKGVLYDLEIVDVSGQHVIFEKLELYMVQEFQRFDAFMICFALDDRVSFENAQMQWTH